MSHNTNTATIRKLIHNSVMKDDHTHIHTQIIHRTTQRVGKVIRQSMQLHSTSFSSTSQNVATEKNHHRDDTNTNANSDKQSLDNKNHHRRGRHHHDITNKSVPGTRNLGPLGTNMNNTMQVNATTTSSSSTNNNTNLDKLRQAFLQSLQVDRERRLRTLHPTNSSSSSNNNNIDNTNKTNNYTLEANNNHNRNSNGNSNNNSNVNHSRIHPSNNTTLSRLDMLLSSSTSTQSSNNNNITNNDNNVLFGSSWRNNYQTNYHQNNNNNNNNTLYNSKMNKYNNNYNNSMTNTTTGVKAFRERRKLAQRMQDSQPFPPHYNGTGNYNNNHNNPYYKQQQQVEYQQIGVDTTVNVRQLQQALAKETAVALSLPQPHTNTNDDTTTTKTILLPKHPMTLSDFSSLLRISRDSLLETYQSLFSTTDKKKQNKKNKKQSDSSSSSSSSSSPPVQKLDLDMMELICLELGLDPQRSTSGGVNNYENENDDYDYSSLPSRPPVVCIMGHVDHGKTTLMDTLRRRSAESFLSKKNTKQSISIKKNSKSTSNSLTTNVAGTEAGGITQVISAFEVALPGLDSNMSLSANNIENGVSTVTFLDTPGHAAFKAMRQSGSNGADVIVLVIAADDGVSNQTVEIIDMFKSMVKEQQKYSKRSSSPISLVIAMNKIDKPGIDIHECIRVIENQLAQHDIWTEGFNKSQGNHHDEKNLVINNVQLFPVSGLTGEGIDELIEGLVLQSEIMDLRSDREGRAEGLIIDAKVEKGLGVVADCLVRWGKLEKGDYIVSGIHGGKVRILNDINNKAMKRANPSQPVRIVGLKSLPKAGDRFVCVQSEEIGNQIISKREALVSADLEKESFRAKGSASSVDIQITGSASKQSSATQRVLEKYGFDMNGDILDGSGGIHGDVVSKDTIRIPVILKADADGTLAALRDILLGVEDESKLDLCVDVVGMSIGHVTSSDIRMAVESGAVIFCFNLKGSKDKTAMSLAANENVVICSHNVIYHLLDEAKTQFSKFFPPVPFEKVHGRAKVQAVFDVNNKRNAEKIAGMVVQDGMLFLDKSNKENGSLACEYRILREGKRISQLGLRAKSLRKVKEEVTDVRRGEECGLALVDYFDLKEGDVVECFSIEMKNVFV